ncbi:MAG: hypothetical protein EXS00_07140 [Phycisphaerales bacterium]|nr:hypothetical protein [Phycisphaerales bacterium]
MEFVEFAHAWTKLRLLGVEEVERTSTHLRLALAETERLAVIDVVASDHPRIATMPGDMLRRSRAEIATAIERLAHGLHLAEVLVIPIGRWRQVFEAVSFAMASHDKWREVDSVATVELNTRDPLLFTLSDHSTLRDLVLAVLTEGKSDTQGVTIVATGTPILIEVMPVGEVIFFAGNPALGALIIDTLGTTSV